MRDKDIFMLKKPIELMSEVNMGVTLMEDEEVVKGPKFSDEIFIKKVEEVEDGSSPNRRKRNLKNGRAQKQSEQS